MDGTASRKKSIVFPQLSGFFLLPLECAKVFYAAGAKLVLCGRNREALEELSKELAASQATKVRPGLCCPWERCSLLQASEGIADPGLLGMWDICMVALCQGSHNVFRFTHFVACINFHSCLWCSNSPLYKYTTFC